AALLSTAQLAPDSGALAAAILQLTRDTSPESVQALENRMAQFAGHMPAAEPDRQAAQAFLAHARLLHDLLPATDETLKALFAVPSQQPLEEARASFTQHRLSIEAAAQRFRL